MTSNQFVRDVHALVADLLVPNVRRYWVDFVASIAIAYAAFAVYLRADAFSVAHIAAFVVSGLAMFRAVAFTHELTHQHASRFRTFAVVWNVLCGVPFLAPSFMYGDHKSHHASRVYGTMADPEYLINGSESRARAAIFLLLSLMYPLLPLFRFLVMTPVAAVSRAADRIVWTYGSSLYIMNESYRREYSGAAGARSRWVQETACCAWAWTLVLLVALRQVPWEVVARTYLVFVFWIALNQVRTLAAHRYGNDRGATMTYLEQLLDTNTFSHGWLLPNLWAPLGLRYHALHHLLPSMPYHAMGQAHGRLVQHLRQDSPYHQTIRAGLWPVLVSRLRARDRTPRRRETAPASPPAYRR